MMQGDDVTAIKNVLKVVSVLVVVTFALIVLALAIA
jgi:hypothetical protein